VRSALRANCAALGFGAGALLSAGAILLIAAPGREVTSLAAFLVKIVPFGLAAEAIARLDLDERVRSLLARAAIPACFLGFFAFFVPKIFFTLDDFEKTYVTMLKLVPYVIIALVLAYRLGGGTAEHARRLAWAMLLLMVSGIEDLAFLTVNNHTDPQWATIPDRWTWASHMKVRLGHYPTKYEAYAFIAVHIIAAVVVLFLPLRFVRRRRALALTVESTPDGEIPRELELEPTR
jgi:hypothetical protein